MPVQVLTMRGANLCSSSQPSIFLASSMNVAGRGHSYSQIQLTASGSTSLAQRMSSFSYGGPQESRGREVVGANREVDSCRQT